ncbi:S-adenosyl-L-methionine-dependent methyltransferase, partial [Sporodiniella umbellata]
PPPSTSPRKQSTVTNNSSKSQTTTNSNKSVKESFNYFEIAAKTSEPLGSPRKTSSNPSSPASSIKKSYINQSSHIHNLTPTTSRSSLSSTAASHNKTNCTVIDGRVYLKEQSTKSFMLPCDDDEADRLTTLHYILKTMFQWNFISPIHELLSSEKKYKVLDIGCGPGTWILEMSTEYPASDFYGIDGCSLFPTSIKPSNANFQVHDILKGALPFGDEMFDFIYMRSLMLYLSPTDLSHLLSEVYRVMKPGAYLEVVDTNYTIRRAGPLSNSLINTECK